MEALKSYFHVRRFLEYHLDLGWSLIPNPMITLNKMIRSPVFNQIKSSLSSLCCSILISGPVLVNVFFIWTSFASFPPCVRTKTSGWCKGGNTSCWRSTNTQWRKFILLLRKMISKTNSLTFRIKFLSEFDWRVYMEHFQSARVRVRVGDKATSAKCLDASTSLLRMSATSRFMNRYCPLERHLVTLTLNTHMHSRDSGWVPHLILFQMMLQFFPRPSGDDNLTHAHASEAQTLFFGGKKTHIIACVDFLLETYI